MTASHRYSHHARRALTHANLLVARYQHPYVDTAHLLVGVMLAEGSIGQRVLLELEVNAQRAEPHLRALPFDTPSNVLTLALSLAADESSWLGHHYIGTEHLLLGITRNNAGYAADLLRRLDTSSEQLRRRLRRAVTEGVTELELSLAKRNARLSELSRRVINAAEQLAVNLDHPVVGMGHLLLVLYHENRSPTAPLLAGLDAERLRQRLQARDPLLLVSIEPLLNRVPEEAEKVGSHYTGTEHLLLTLALDEAGRALLEACGLDAAALLAKLSFGAH